MNNGGGVAMGTDVARAASMNMVSPASDMGHEHVEGGVSTSTVRARQYGICNNCMFEYSQAYSALAEAGAHASLP